MKKCLLIITIISLYSCTTRVPYANKIDDLHNNALKLDPIWDYKPTLFTYSMAAGYAGAGFAYIQDSDLKWINLLVPLFALSIVSRGPGVTVNGKRTNSVKFKHYDEWLQKLNRKNNKDYVFAEKDEDYVIIVPRFQLASYLQHKKDLENKYNTGGGSSDFWSTAIIIGGSVYLLWQGTKYLLGTSKSGNSTSMEEKPTPENVNLNNYIVVDDDIYCNECDCKSFTCISTGKIIRIKKLCNDSYVVGAGSNKQLCKTYYEALKIASNQTNCN